MINGSLNNKAINSQVKNLQQIISKRKKVMDSAGQNTVTGGHITILIEPCINDIKENQKSLFPG